ncbi:MAG: hypothetical protein Q8J66_09705 [Methylotenera sp.]|nr:hypothetical protein [Methylotenera sp.]
MAKNVKSQKPQVRAKVREFVIPVVRDGVVLGREAPLGCVAIRRALDLLIAAPFEHIEIEDDVISDIMIRKAILRRIPRENVIDFVLKSVKPLMGAEEIMHLDLDVEIMVEYSGR